MPRIVPIALNSRKNATRSSSRCEARSRSPIAGPAGWSGSPAAIRSDCSDAIERICSGEKPSWSGQRSWNAAEMNVFP